MCITRAINRGGHLKSLLVFSIKKDWELVCGPFLEIYMCLVRWTACDAQCTMYNVQCTMLR